MKAMTYKTDNGRNTKSDDGQSKSHNDLTCEGKIIGDHSDQIAH